MNSSVQQAVSDVDRRMELSRLRMAQLESTEFHDLEAWAAAINETVQLESELAALATRRALLETYAELLETTPARSGRARAGWTFSTTDSFPEPEPFPNPDTYDEGRVQAVIHDALASLPDDPFIAVTLGNGVPYIGELEAGLSDQAAGFTATAFAGLQARLARQEI